MTIRYHLTFRYGCNITKIFRIEESNNGLHFSENVSAGGKIIDIIFNRRMNELPLASGKRISDVHYTAQGQGYKGKDGSSND
jgi:hypothetical protein